MKRKKLMAIAAVFALLCAAIVFTGCPQGNQNKGTASNTEKEKESKKEKEKDKQKDKKDNDKEEDDDTSKSADYAPFTGKYNETLWRPKNENNTEAGHEFFYYFANGKVYYSVFNTEKNDFIRATEVGTVKKGKMILKGGNKESYPVSIVGSTLYVDPDGSKPMRFEQETDRGLLKKIKKYLE